MSSFYVGSSIITIIRGKDLKISINRELRNASKFKYRQRGTGQTNDGPSAVQWRLSGGGRGGVCIGRKRTLLDPLGYHSLIPVRHSSSLAESERPTLPLEIRRNLKHYRIRSTDAAPSVRAFFVTIISSGGSGAGCKLLAPVSICDSGFQCFRIRVIVSQVTLT